MPKSAQSILPLENPSADSAATDNSDAIQQPDLIDHNLSLTPEQRAQQHQNALDTINELKNARKQLYGESESSTEAPA